MTAKPMVDETIATAVEAVEEVTKRSGQRSKDVVTLGSGIKLRVTAAPALFLRQAIQRVKEPAIPKVFIESADRWEENPNDPDYIKVKNGYTVKIAEIGLNVMLLMGTKVEYLPKGAPGPESSEWADILEVLGSDPGRNEKERYLIWLKYILDDPQELQMILQAVAVKSGMTEVEVAAAIESFQSDA